MSSFDHKGPADTRHALFGGVGDVRVFNLLGARAMPPFANVLACSLDPGGKVGVHVQQEFAEILVGLRGDGVAVVNGKRVALQPFDVVHLPLGARLEIANESHEHPLEYLIIKAKG